MPNFGVRVDAKSPVIGMQNVIRCISLAIELSKKFHNVYFFTKYDASFDKIKSEGFNVFKIADKTNVFAKNSRNDRTSLGEDPVELKELFIKHCIDVLIVDLPFASEQYFEKFLPKLKKIIQIEDDLRFTSPSHVIINGSIYSKDFEYPDVPGQVLLVGPEYCLIDNSISDSKERKLNKNVKDIFLHVDALHKTNFTVNILKTLISDPVTKSLTINTFVDSSFLENPELNSLVTYHPNIVIHSNPDKLLDIIMDSGIAISNDVFSIYRLLACGVPTISFIVPEHDESISENTTEIIENIWEHKYIGLVAEDANLNKTLIKKVHKLLENVLMRTTLSERGRKSIDGMGAYRIAEAIEKILK